MTRTTGTGLLFLFFIYLPGEIPACTDCRPFVEKGVYNSSFLTNLFFMALPLVIIVALGITVYFSDKLKLKLKGIKLWQIRKLPESGRL